MEMNRALDITTSPGYTCIRPCTFCLTSRILLILKEVRHKGYDCADAADTGSGSCKADDLGSVVLVVSHQRRDAPKRDIADGEEHAPDDVGSGRPDHDQRFGEALQIATEKMDQKNVYVINPAFDRK